MKGIEFLDKMELWVLPAWRRADGAPKLRNGSWRTREQLAVPC